MQKHSAAVRRVLQEDKRLAASVGKGACPAPQPTSMSVDLQGDSSLQVEISDAVSKQDKVKFTVQARKGAWVREQSRGLPKGFLASRAAFLILPTWRSRLCGHMRILPGYVTPTWRMRTTHEQVASATYPSCEQIPPASPRRR